jgi:hypothetical protein
MARRASYRPTFDPAQHYTPERGGVKVHGTQYRGGDPLPGDVIGTRRLRQMYDQRRIRMMTQEELQAKKLRKPSETEASQPAPAPDEPTTTEPQESAPDPDTSEQERALTWKHVGGGYYDVYDDNGAKLNEERLRKHEVKDQYGLVI